MEKLEWKIQFGMEMAIFPYGTGEIFIKCNKLF